MNPRHLLLVLCFAYHGSAQAAPICEEPEPNICADGHTLCFEDESCFCDGNPADPEWLDCICEKTNEWDD